MLINHLAAKIIRDNIKSDKKIYSLSLSKLKKLFYKHIYCDGQRLAVFGYERDVTKFLKVLPDSAEEIICEYANPENWKNNPGQDFLGEEQILRIAGFQVDKLVIVSDDLRYLAQMHLITEGISYEIVDIYALIKREYARTVVKSISNTSWEIMKEYVKWGGVWLSERFTALREVQCVKYWREECEKKCDNYDAILVKKYFAQEARDDKEKKYYLRELIINYLLIRDFQNAFLYIDEYTDLFGKEENAFLNVKDSFMELFSQMKAQLADRKKKDIIIFWCDNMPYSEFKEFSFLKEEAKDSLVFENAYTHVPYTHTTTQALFAGIPFFENGLYEWKHPNFVKHGRTMDLLEANDYEICEIHNNYIQQRFTRKLYYTVKSSRPPGTMHLWEMLAQILENQGKKQYIVCHMMCELHPPYWNGESLKMRTAGNNIYSDEKLYANQIKESAAYLEKQILWYSSFLGENVCRIYMSDHGIGTPRYIEDRIHTFCFVKDSGIARGSYQGLFSYLNFCELIKYILQPTEENLGRVFSEYVLIQNDHPYSVKFCRDIINKLEKGEDVHKEKWMGFRGIIKDDYKLVIFPTGEEYWFDLLDNKIESDDIDPQLVKLMRDKVGNEFADIGSSEHYKETRKLYERLHINLKNEQE